MVNKAIYFFSLICYNFYGDNMDIKDLRDTILLLQDKVNIIWRLL